MAKYCDSKELEEWWAGWLITRDPRNWEQMTEMLYKICLGIAKKFRPINDDEYTNLANEAITKLLQKIKDNKLRFKPTSSGGSPVFNLVTTTVQRILCSYKNSDKKRKINHSKYVRVIVQEKAPEMLSSISDLYGSDGGATYNS